MFPRWAKGINKMKRKPKVGEWWKSKVGKVLIVYRWSGTKNLEGLVLGDAVTVSYCPTGEVNEDLEPFRTSQYDLICRCDAPAAFRKGAVKWRKGL
jgi:hypothetical protein